MRVLFDLLFFFAAKLPFPVTPMLPVFYPLFSLFVNVHFLGSFSLGGGGERRRRRMRPVRGGNGAVRAAGFLFLCGVEIDLSRGGVYLAMSRAPRQEQDATVFRGVCQLDSEQRKNLRLR